MMLKKLHMPLEALDHAHVGSHDTKHVMNVSQLEHDSRARDTRTHTKKRAREDSGRVRAGHEVSLDVNGNLLRRRSSLRFQIINYNAQPRVTIYELRVTISFDAAHFFMKLHIFHKLILIFWVSFLNQNFEMFSASFLCLSLGPSIASTVLGFLSTES